MMSAHSSTGKTGSVCRHYSPGALPNVFGQMNGQNGGSRVVLGNKGGGKMKGRGRKKKGHKGGHMGGGY